MTDFFANLKDKHTQDTQEKKLRGSYFKMSEIQISKSDICELKNNICGRMKLSLPKSENHTIKQTEIPETFRTRRGGIYSIILTH